MGNMSYCRFQNTLRDLRDCNDHLFDNDLSDEEKKARTKLIIVCRSIVHDSVDIDDEDESDYNSEADEINDEDLEASGEAYDRLEEVN